METGSKRTGKAAREAGSGLLARLHREWLEIFATALLALATLASAWSAYQASRWRSREALLLSESNSARIHADEADDLADAELEVDVTMFLGYLDAINEGDMQAARRYEEDLFRDELKVAVELWKPLHEGQAAAPPTPFEMPEYRNANRERANELEREADAKRAEAAEALRRSDNYVLLTVLFAAVLFFAGLCTKFKVPGVRFAVLIMGYLLFLVSMAVMAFYPLA